MTRQNRNTLLFLGFLLLAGLAYNHTREGSAAQQTLLFLANFMIYAGLLLFWMQSVHTRMLPSRARDYMIASAIFMLAFLTLRVLKYHLIIVPLLLRYATYLYYVPMALIPALFLMTSIRVGHRENSGREYCLLIPAVILAGAFLTNDLHSLMYRPDVPPASFAADAGTYHYGACFYLTYVWMIACMLAGVIILLLKTGNADPKKLLLPAAVILIWVAMNMLLIRANRLDIHRPYNMPEIQIFFMLGMFETCIRNHLIPCNENYAGFFERLRMPVLITDRVFSPAYQTAQMLCAGREQLSDSLRMPVYVDPDHRLSGTRIRAGFAFWEEDESAVHRANERLQEANCLIESENTLIRYENEQKEKLAYLDAHHRIYHEIAQEMYPVQKSIEDALNQVDPEAEDYRSRIAWISILNAYVKRKTNLLLLASESDSLNLHELYLALEESGRYLSCAGVRTSTQMSFAGGELPAKTLIALYDAFENIAEQLPGRATLLMTVLDGERITQETDTRDVQIPEMENIAVIRESREESLYLELRIKKGGDQG